MPLRSFHKKALLILFSFYLIPYSFSQPYQRTDSIPVKAGSVFLKNPWVGGHNFCQFSDIDINQDGIRDLFVFDRSGNRITAYINKGTPNTVDYADSTEKYKSGFPPMEDWAILLDYNNDGKEDIFTYGITVGGIKVWKNTSSAGNLQFTLATPYIRSDYTPSVTTDPLSNLYCSRVDIPGIEDLDNDGDKDIITFDFSSTYVEHHINRAVELGYPLDSLVFILDPAGCWGNFQENASNCSVNLGACRMIAPGTELPVATNTSSASQPSYTDGERHAGSCSLCLDMDADGDKEVLIGDISCCNMTLLTNGGTPSSANMTAKDTVFPSGNISVNMSIFPCGYFLDVNNDNKRDLIVSPNAANISVNSEGIWYYQNTGTDLAPVFSRIKRDLFQDDMIDAGEGADPVLFDFDSDGLTDLLISTFINMVDSCPKNNLYNVLAYKNTGTASAPQFELVNSDYANLSTQIPNLAAKHLAFGDLDNDGDQDMMIGDYDGKLHYFDNGAGAGNPCNFILTTPNYPDNSAVPIDVGNYAAPQLLDADRDGDLDLLIGERAGNINYYPNTGTPSVPSFDAGSFTANFGGVDTYKPCCTGYSIPFMFDSAGSYRMIVGSEASRISGFSTGWVFYYTSIDGNLGGNFTLVDSMYLGIWEGLRMTVHGKDITNDGKMDLVIGNYSGGVILYLGDSNTVSVNTLPSASFDFYLFPNPSAGQFTLTMSSFNPGKKYELRITNLLGEVILEQTVARNQETIRLDAPNGIYSCEIITDHFSSSKKLIIIK